MLMEAAFTADGQWFKGNLHTHTTESDGSMSPQDTADAYREAGYDFIAITDHEKVTDVSGLSQNDFLVMPGTELGVGAAELGQPYHVVCLGVTQRPDPAQCGALGDVIAATRGLGGEAHVAHPYWSGLTCKDLLGHEHLLGIEVYNTTCDVSIGKGHSAVQWDDLLARGEAPLGLAVDDMHHHPSDSMQGWIMLRAEALEQEAVMAALRAGRFYSSMGPNVRTVELSGDTLHVSCSPVARINFICAVSRGRCAFAEDGNTITEASLTLSGAEGYVRVECIDERGRMAWTNPKVLHGGD